MNVKSKFPVNNSFYEVRHIRDFKDIINQSEKLFSERPAYKLRNKDGIYYEVTYSNFRHSIYYLANSLVNDNYSRTHIAVVGANSYNWSVTYLAVTCSDNVIVPIDKELTPDNMMDVIKDSDSTVLFGDKKYIAKKGDVLEIDECRIEFLYNQRDGLYSNPMNDASLVFKLITPSKSVLFLGDLGPEGGDILLEECYDRLPSDMVQMAHHGHMNVGMEVYAAVGAKTCLWCAPDWLYAEEELPDYLKNPQYLAPDPSRLRMYGTAITRQWMDQLGATAHYVTKDGTQSIVL